MLMGVYINRLYHKKMTQLEIHIATIIEKDQVEIKDLTINQLADRCSVSIAMINKFAQNCGFTGYKELKFYLSQEMQQTKTIKNYLIEDKIGDFFANLDSSQTNSFKQLIKESDTVILYGTGASFGVCEYFESRFRAAFRKNFQAEMDHQQLDYELNIGANKLVIIISASAIGEDIDSLLEKCHQRKSKVILISEDFHKDRVFNCDLYIHFLNYQLNRKTNVIFDRTLFFIYLESIIQSNL